MGKQDGRPVAVRRFRCFNAHCYFWFARKASRELKLKLTYYFSSIVAQLLKLSTICKSPLHGPRNYVDHTWERSANYSARTDQGLKQFFCEFPNNISLLQNNNRPHTALFPVWSSESMFTQIQKNFVLASLPSQCFKPRQPARIALNFPPNLFVRWESLC